MPYVPFYQVDPELAQNETRVITLPESNSFNLPRGEYAFLELYCNECDCQRVFLHVYFNRKHVTSIAYGWASLDFYRKEFRGFSNAELDELKGPSLDSFQVQSALSDKIFNMFLDMLFSDKAYMERIVTHYYRFKKKVKKIRF